MYMLIDRNANGDIDKQELSKFMIKYYDKSDIRYKSDKIFSNIDVDDNGTIEFSEFKVCSLSFKFEDIIIKMKRLYALTFDKSSNYITIGEIVNAMQDGNQTSSLYKYYLVNLFAKDFKLKKEDFRELISNMYEDFKIISN